MTASLHPYHSFHLTTYANAIIEYDSIEQLFTEWRACTHRNEPVLLLGQGSNVLFLENFAGTVLVNRLKGIDTREDEQFYYLHVAGGENWHALVEWTLVHNIAGLENLALIPGVVGSAPIQNIGAYGVEFERVCHYVDVLNLHTGEQFRLSRNACQFGYRNSIFKQQYQGHYAIIAVGLKLAKAWQPVLNYGSLSQFDPQSVTPQQIFEEVCAIRRAKLPDPDQLGNAGSFFKNPVVTATAFHAIQTAYPTIPHYPQTNGDIKLPAGWLIDHAHLKGYQIGGAAVHTEQALVLINKNNATGTDILTLAKTVRHKVREKFGVELHPEVRFIGAQGEINSEEATR